MMNAPSPPAPLSPPEFERFRDYFYEKSGIYFGESKLAFVEKRVHVRMQAQGSVSFRDYFSRVRQPSSGRELQALLNLLTINETYFFREDYQLACMVNSVLPEILRLKESGEAIRIWSIPCSTGEEPYSIALSLLERWPPINEVDVEIVASDVDTVVLESCRSGIYNQRSVQFVPKGILRQYFTRVGDDRYQISEDIRDAIEFRRTNLVNPDDTRCFRGFDMVFCRNLLIYFDDASRRLAVDVIYDALAPGGFIFLGHSESMSRISSLFVVRKFPDCIIYQKPLGRRDHGRRGGSEESTGFAR